MVVTFYIPIKVYENSNCFTVSPKLVMIHLVNYHHYTGYIVVVHWSFEWHSHRVKWYWVWFNVLLYLQKSSLLKYLFKYYANFKLGYLSYYWYICIYIICVYICIYYIYTYIFYIHMYVYMCVCVYTRSSVIPCWMIFCKYFLLVF